MKAMFFILCAGAAVCTASAGVISLSADTSPPDPNEEITVWVHTDEPLLFLELDAYVTGDAAITSAMSEADCNDFGWENGWGIEPIIDNSNGWVSIGGICWAADANDIVGYFKIRYNSGQVAVYIDQDNSVAGNWGGNFTFSEEALLFGEIVLPPLREPNEPTPVLIQCLLGSGGPPRGEPNSFPEWSQQFEMLSMLDLEPSIIEINSDITTNQVWDANNIYYVTEPNGINVQALLVIEPGTTVIFGFGWGLFVNHGGVLISRGTPDKPILYTSDFMHFYYPESIGSYWQILPYYGPLYYSPLYIQDTASPATTITYSMIEGAVGGIVTDNIRLINPIENNYLFGNIWGIYELGPMLTDIHNNLCFFNDEAGIEAYLGDANGIVDAENIFTIEQNTCAVYQYCGITVHGAAEPNEVPTVHLLNNIVSGSYWYGLNIGGGPMWLLAANTGYYNNYYNKNWEFDEYNPVYAETNPYYPYVGEKSYQHHYLASDSAFIDAGAQYIEQTKLIGMTTNFDSLPDKDLVDLGFHSMDWNYTGGEGIAGTDMDDVAEIANYWLTYTPYDPNSPYYQDPNIIDPNTISYGGDWNDDGFVDLADFAIMSQTWNATPAVPNLTPVITGEPNDGWIQLSVSGCNSDTQLVYAYINGKYIGQVYMLGDAIPVTVDVSESGNQPQEVKFMAIDLDGNFAYSDISHINYTSPLIYCIVPQVYEPNQPIPFAAYNTGPGDSTVEMYGNGGQLLWSQNFTGNTINGSIPAAFTGEQQLIDSIVFTSASGGSVTKTTFPEVSWRGVDKKVKALMIMPANDLFIRNPHVRLRVFQAFRNKGIDVKRFEGPEATWENAARYGQFGNIKYIYFLGHGNYKYEYGDPNTPTVIYRTRQAFADSTVVSMKASEYTNPPLWCKPFPENIERTVKTWASMDFRQLIFVYNGACYGGRLKINGFEDLVEGQPGEMGLYFDGPHSDMSLALQLNDPYKSRCYHGWYDPSWVSCFYPHNEDASYVKWGVDIWEKLGEGKNLEDAILYAAEEAEDKRPQSAYQNFRLKGLCPDLKWIYLHN